MIQKVLPNVYIVPPITRIEMLGPLQELKVSHVVNAAGILNGGILEAGNLKYHISNWVDNGKDQTKSVWERLARFLNEFLQTPDAVLAIHCIGGPRRSASTLYLLLRLKGLTDDEAIAFIKGVIPDHQPIYSGPINDWLGSQE